VSRRLVLLRFGTDPVARICSGANPIRLPGNAVDAEPEYYLGGGKLVEVPELEQVINGTAQRIDITVSGVSKATVALFRDESAGLQGAPVHIGVAHQDAAWQITEVEWLGELRCDVPASQHSRSSRSISISLGSENTDRSKAPLTLWTPADQRRRSPTDQFFDGVPGLSQGTSRKFGPND
jgi:hypothetical protein